jgi:hypothetical protein
MKKIAAVVLAAAVFGLAAPREARAVVKLTVNPSGVVTQSCYTPADAEAEQAIRLRSIMMVIGLNCQASRFRGTADNLYADYRQFVADHGERYAAYEKQMMDYFARGGSADPEADLNRMATEFGNAFSLDVAKMRPDMFCYQYSKSLLRVKNLNDDAFHAWVLTPDALHPPLHPMCGGQD